MTTVTFKDLLQTITPPPGVVGLLTALLLLSSLLSLVSPWLAGQITAELLDTTAMTAIPWLLGAWLLLLIGTSLLNFLVTYQSAVQGELMCSGLRTWLHSHMQDMPISHFYNNASGDTLSYFTNDIENVGYFVTDSLIPAIPMLLQLAAILVLMAIASPVIAIAAVVLLPAYYLAVKLIGRRLRSITGDWVDAYAAIVTVLEQRLGNMALIKLFSSRPEEQKRFAEKNTAYVELSRRQHLLQSAIAPISTSLAAAGLVLVLWLGAREIGAGHLTPAELVMLVLYANLMRTPVTGLASLYGHYQVTHGAAERLLNLLNTATESDNGQPLQADTIKLSFRDLTFSYDAPLFHNVTADIEPGQVVALSGANGSGKSTLAFLIMSLLKADRGQLFINGMDITTLSPSSLRANISFVSQNTLLLNDTIAANICLESDADIEALQAAAHAVQADTWIESLPHGYDTLVGNQGLRLSGGQRQKLALARAMYKNAPLLIMDEPTSMFDTQAEAAFVEGCRALFAGRTVLIISHSPRLLCLADRQLSLQNQTLIEEAIEPGAIVGEQQ